MVQCFFFVERESEEDDGTVRTLCLEHGKFQKGAWFYQGEVGPWTLKCHKCNKILYQHVEKKDEKA